MELPRFLRPKREKFKFTYVDIVEADNKNDAMRRAIKTAQEMGVMMVQFSTIEEVDNQGHVVAVPR